MTRLLAINLNSVRKLRAQSKSEIDKNYNNFFCKSVLSFMYYYVIEIFQSDKLSVFIVSLPNRKRK
jgi:hypothetical protein